MPGDRRGDTSAGSGRLFSFGEVFQAETVAVNGHRRSRGLPEVHLELELGLNTENEPVYRPHDGSDLVGLALPGGGIRSAAFCLGALQAMHNAEVLKRVDYLSTVSGGGYIGASLTAALHTRGRFPFSVSPGSDEPPAVQHLRNHSNYIAPRGMRDWLFNGAIYARGLAANAILIAPFVLSLAAVTILLYPETRLQAPGFPGTAHLGLLLLLVLIAWSLDRSSPVNDARPEITPTASRWKIETIVVSVVAGLFLLVALLESQAFLLDARLRGGRWFEGAASWVNTATAALAPLAAVVAFFARQLGEFSKSATESRRKRTKFAGLAANAGIYLAGLFVPLLLWTLYLQLSVLGVCDPRPRALYSPAGALPSHAASVRCNAQGQNNYWVPLIYFVAAFGATIVALLLRPNANSLHALYRDRLGKAFLFRPRRHFRAESELRPLSTRLSKLCTMCGPYHIINAALNVQGSKVANRRGRNADFFALSPLFVGSRTTGYVTTAQMEMVAKELNLASAVAISGAAASSNMGSATMRPLVPTLALLNVRLGYWLRNPLWFRHRTETLMTRGVDRAVAFLQATAPPQATFNGRVRRALRLPQLGERLQEQRKRRNFFANFYFVLELLGLLDEKKKSVFLTDGGHIENLGMYELLRRRCKVIVAVDAEADKRMGFGSFNILQRYAWIDLGVAIDLPWQDIANVTRDAGREIDDHGDTEKRKGPHCALGIIHYPGGRKGLLLYIKSSITGDEDDAIFHYKKRYPDFPHETTLDQMFSEEQFECYRDLGHHAASRFFRGEDAYAHRDPLECPEVLEAVAALRRVFPSAALRGL